MTSYEKWKDIWIDNQMLIDDIHQGRVMHISAARLRELEIENHAILKRMERRNDGD